MRSPINSVPKYAVVLAVLALLLFAAQSAYGVTKTFTGTASFSNAANSTGGTLPVAGDDLVIDGACTVDNDVGTSNVLYGTLTIGTATGRSLSWAVSGTNILSVTNVSAGAGASTLNMTNGGTLLIRGTWTSTNLTFTPGTGTINANTTITLPAAYATYTNLTVNGGTASLGTTTTVTGTLFISGSAGALNANNFDLMVGGSWLNNKAGALGFTAGTGTVTFNGTQSISGVGTTTFNNLTITAGTRTIAANTVVSGALTVTAGTLAVGAFSLSVTGATSVSGTLSITSTTGVKTFTGNVTINNGGSWTETANAGISFGGNLQNDGTLTAGTGTHTFTGTTKTFSGASSISLPNTAVIGSYTNNGTLTVGTALSGTGSLTQGASDTLNLGGTSSGVALVATASGNIVNFNGAAQTVNNINYYHLIFGGSGAKTLQTSTTIISGDLTLNGTVTTTTVVGLAISGNLSAGSGTTVTFGAFTITVTGTTSVSGTLSMNGTSGTKTFTGNITINNGGSWTEPSDVVMTLGGNLQNDGTFTAGTGAHTFSGTAKTIGGANAVALTSLTISGTTTNNGTLTVSTTLAGASTLTNGATGILNFGGVTVTPTLTASASGNTVNYTRAGAQNVKAATYYHLTVSGSGVKTVPAITVNGKLSMQGTATVSAAPTYGATATLEYKGSATQAAGPELLVTMAAGRTVIIDNANGVTVAGSYTIDGTLTFTNGNLIAGINTLYIGSGGVVSRTSGHVLGYFAKYILTGASTTNFEVGDASNYTPVQVSFANATAAGYVIVSAVAGDHANIGSSKIDGTKSVNRFWNVINSGVAFALCDVTFNFVAGDIDGGSNTALFGVGQYNAGSWNYQTVGARTATSTQITGANSLFGDYQVGTIVHSLAGNISDGGSPMSGVTVTLSGGQAGTTTTDGSGNYIFYNLASTGTYTMTPSLANYGFGPASLTYGGLNSNVTGQNFYGGIARTVSGTVKNASNVAISGVTMTLTGWNSGTTTTDVNGYYSFTNLPTGNGYTITPTKTGYTFVATYWINNNLTADATANFTGTPPSCVSAASGNWSAPATWGTCRGGVPTSLDPVEISGGFTVTVDDSNAVAESIKVGGYVGTGNGTLVFNAASKVTVSGSVIVGGNAVGNTGTITMTAGGTLTAGSLGVGTGAPTFTPGTGTVELTANNTTPAAFTTFNNLQVSAGTTTLGGNPTIGGNLNITAGTLTTGTVTLVVTGATTVGGTLNVNSTSGSKTFTGDVTINNGGTWNEAVAEAIAFGGSLQNDGTFTASNGVHTFSGTTKTISGANAIAIPSLTISGTTTNNGTLTVSTTLAGASTLTNGATGILNFGGVTVTPTLAATAAGNLVNYTLAGAQTVKATTYENLTLSGSGAKTTTSITVNGKLSMQGTATASAAPAYGATATLEYKGSAAQMEGAEFLATMATGRTVNIDNTNGVTLAGNSTVDGTLTLTSGRLNTSSFALYLSSSAVVTRTSGYVVGNLKKYIATGATSKTFEIGDASNYTPALISFSSVTTAGDLTGSVAAGDHSNIGTSTIIPTKSVNRNWTLTNSGIVFTSYGATFTFVAADLDAGSTTSTFIVGKYSGGWTYPTVGTKTSTSTEATGLTAFSDFQLGELNGAKTWDGGAGTNNWGDAANWNPDGVPASTDTVDLTGANTININMAAVANNLTLNNPALILTINSGNSLAISGALTMTSGSLNTGTNTISGAGSFTLGSGGNLGVGSTAGITSSGASGNVQVSGTRTFSTAGNYSYNGTSAQVTGNGLPATVNNLTINNSAGVTLSATVAVSSDLTVTAGTFDLSSFTANRVSSGGILTVADGATLKIGGTNGFPLSYTTKTLGAISTVEYSGTAQAVGGQNYGHLTLSNSGLKTFGTVALSNIRIAGALTISGTATTDLTTNTTNVSYNGAAAQTILGLTYYDLTASTSGTKTLAANAIVNNNLAVSNSAILDLSSFNANRATAGGTLTLSSTARLKIGGTNSLPSNYSTHVIAATTTLEYSGTTQSVAALNSAQDYGHLIISGSGTKTLAGTENVAGNLTISAGTFDLGANTINRTAAGGTLTISNGAALKIGGTNPFPSNYTTHSVGVTSTIEYCGTTQSVIALNSTQNYGNLTISGSLTKNLAATISVTGDLTVSAGTFDLGSFTANRASAGGTLSVASSATLKIGGTNTFPSNYSTHSLAFVSVVEYAGTNQIVGALNSAQEYSGLTISGSGTKTLTGDLNVAGTLTLTSGTLTTGAHTIYSKVTGNVFRVSGWVNGNLRRFINTGAPARIFYVGDATNYTPVDVQFASVTTGGDLTVSVVASDHANIGTSTINAAKSVNRTWTLANSGVVFTTYDATFTFVAGDVDGAANTANFIVGKYSGGEWFYPTVGTKSATTTQTTGVTAFSDFQLGELAPPPTYTVSGNVFEDKNYGGGSGRSVAASSGVARPGARVELFNSSGTYQTFATTDGIGNYAFSGLVAGNYTVRVVNASVTTSRGVFTSTPTQTFRTDASSGAAVAVTDHVGGEAPGLLDAVDGSTTLAALTTAGFTAQSITSVVLSSGNISGVDFGYSFNVIVNANNSGQGSLRRVLNFANAISNSGLAQSGLPAGIDNAVFMLADGTSRLGLTASYPSQFVSGVATVNLTSVLTTVSDPIILDGTLQPGYTGNPIIELNGAGAGAGTTGITITAGGSTVRGFIINRFTLDGIGLTTGGNNTIAGNYIGTNALGSATSANSSDGIIITSANNTIGGTNAAARNVISGNTGQGIHLDGAGATGNLVQGNYIGTNASGTGALANSSNGVYVLNGAVSNTIGGTAAGAGNLISGNSGKGVVIAAGTGDAILSNSIYGNAGIGIDLANDGVTANDGTKSGALANYGMDTPVFTRMSLVATTLSIAGYVGNAASQSTFAGASVQMFKSDNDASGFGEGQIYLGTLTADSNGNFSGTLTVSLAIGDKVTATTTDASNNTSEFAANVDAVSGSSVPDVTLTASVSPNATAPPGTDLVYSISFSNNGESPAYAFVITDPIPTNTDFKVGSATNNLGTTGLTVTVAYSDDDKDSWTYTPVSTTGGAPVGYDRTVTHVRWSFAANLSQTSPNNSGSVGLTTRIQ